MTHVGLYGGAFDPPHFGHLLVGSYFLNVQPKARLWLLPSFEHPFEKSMAPFALRLKWCQALAKILGPRCLVSAVESDVPGKGRSLIVVKELQRRHPRTHFQFILGADAYRHRRKWYRFSELEQLVDFFIIGRGELPSPDGWLAMPEVSSTEIRRRIEHGEPIDALVPDAVRRLIERSGHYRR